MQIELKQTNKFNFFKRIDKLSFKEKIVYIISNGLLKPLIFSLFLHKTLSFILPNYLSETNIDLLVFIIYLCFFAKNIIKIPKLSAGEGISRKFSSIAVPVAICMSFITIVNAQYFWRFFI